MNKERLLLVVKFLDMLSVKMMDDACNDLDWPDYGVVSDLTVEIKRLAAEHDNGKEKTESIMIHDLKIEQQYLDSLIAGTKKSEIRLNDRDYQKGDILRFYSYKNLKPTKYLFEITHIHSGLGMERNYVVLSVKAKAG